jgi:hypothetical protein
MYAGTSNGYQATALPYEVYSVLPYSGVGYDWAIPADAYGIDVDNNGYFLAYEYNAFVRPAGIPLVFGSNNSLLVSKSTNGNPSIIVPGNGFLNESGKYGSYTLEAWVRLNNQALDPVRIIGPIGSTDGIYLEEGFISLYVGPYAKSYFVGKFNRPMLLHMTYSDSRVALMINGEQVISMEIDVSTFTLPEKYLSGYSQDWIGVFGSDYVKPFEIDCLAIFPYLLPAEVAKKHFIYGQAVQEPDFSNDKFVKRSVQFDFPYAEYAHSVIYPDTNGWRSGFSINLDSNSTVLKASKHPLPAIVLNSPVSDAEWFLANKAENEISPEIFPYVKIGAQSLSPFGGTIFFKNLNITNDKIVAVAASFKMPTYDAGDQTLIAFLNNATGERVSARIIGTNVEYNYYDPYTFPTTLYVEPFAYGELFTAGFHIPGMSASATAVIGNFFSSQERLSVYIGGDNMGTFAGSIYNIHFASKYFFDKDLSGIFSNGIIQQEPVYSMLMNYIGNYSLLPVFKNNSMGFDIGAAGYWEDLLPLSVFGKTVTASAGTAYQLDTIQFNIDTPYTKTYAANYVNSLSYGGAIEFLELTAQDYAYFATLGFTTYQSVIDYISTNSADLRYSTGFSSYITLQRFDTVGNNLYSDFIYTEPAPLTNVITPLSSEIANTKYEIFDDCIIIPPADIDFTEYYIGIHLEMRVRGTYDKNMTVKRLELASYVNNDSSVVTKLGTKYSYPVYPFAVAS